MLEGYASGFPFICNPYLKKNYITYIRNIECYIWISSLKEMIYSNTFYRRENWKW